MSDEEQELSFKSLGKLINQQVFRSLEREFEAETAGHRSKPEGIVAIMFTDVEDSSGLVVRLGDAAARTLLRRHDEILRRVVAAHQGVEIERAGDGFMIAFGLASHAVECALALQQALAEDAEISTAGLRLRAGVETGEVIAEEKGYFGRTVFQASRVSDLASGGQIIVSEATRLIAGRDAFAYQDLGEHELKGLGGAHRLYAVAGRAS